MLLLLSFTKNICAQKINVDDYKNKAQAYAILSAQYSNDAYQISRENYFVNDIVSIKESSDSAIILVQIALNYSDSALMFAYDSCVFAKNLLVDVEDFQNQSLKRLQYITEEFNYSTIHNLSREVMYAMGNAIADAYRASLELDWKDDSLIFVKDKVKENRDATRLETDETTFLTVKELYTKRLSEIDQEISLLESDKKKKSGASENNILVAIAQLKAEKKELLDKSKNSEDKLIQVRNDLSEEMLKTVNKDFFTTDKKGFYNENVPIPDSDEFPQGLVYKVQIGFFKKKLSSEHYDGVFPISTQKVDKDYYKYLAGNFKYYTEAKEASLALRKKGYNDAFVVSYINGVKVPVSEALKYEKEKK
ncbi:MAG: SPOR domain-containing protein [Flavobacteriales bacterium]